MRFLFLIFLFRKKMKTLHSDKLQGSFTKDDIPDAYICVRFPTCGARTISPISQIFIRYQLLNYRQQDC